MRSMQGKNVKTPKMTTSSKDAEGEVVSSHSKIKANLTAHRELSC